MYFTTYLVPLSLVTKICFISMTTECLTVRLSQTKGRILMVQWLIMIACIKNAMTCYVTETCYKTSRYISLNNLSNECV